MQVGPTLRAGVVDMFRVGGDSCELEETGCSPFANKHKSQFPSSSRYHSELYISDKVYGEIWISKWNFNDWPVKPLD